MNRYARLMKPQVDSPISLQPLTIDAMNMMQTKFPIAETMIEGSKNWTPTQHGQVEEKGGSMNSNEETTKTVNVKDEVENHDTIIAFRTEVRRVVREIIEDEFNKELDALKKKMAAQRN